MKQSHAVLLIAAAVCLCAAPGRSFAQTPDEPDEQGCKDSPVLSRLAGCRIFECETKDFDAVDVQIGAVDASGDVRKKPLDQTAVKVQGMAQEMTATAEGMAAEMGKSGRVAVYGINFDTGKATIRPDSDAVLGEVAKVLKTNPGWKIKIEGHTDNVGAKEANKKLSEDRAEAVEKWLVAHGVDKARLSHDGYGDTRPAADNSTEQGRAKNRRVELVKVG